MRIGSRRFYHEGARYEQRGVAKTQARRIFVFDGAIEPTIGSVRTCKVNHEALSNHLYDSRIVAFRIAVKLMHDGLAAVLVGDAPLHHELHMFELGDISERIAVNGDKVGIAALLHGADVNCVAD